jgi:hypothetical protein
MRDARAAIGAEDPRGLGEARSRPSYSTGTDCVHSAERTRSYHQPGFRWTRQ